METENIDGLFKFSFIAAFVYPIVGGGDLAAPYEWCTLNSNL